MKFKNLFIALNALLCICLPTETVAQDARTARCLYQIECRYFDVVLVIGQSNATSRGVLKRPRGLMSSPRIFQLGREQWDFEVVPAAEPVYHVKSTDDYIGGIGFAIPFALHYERYSLDEGRQVLIVPAAKGGTSVLGPDAYWAPNGEGLYDVHQRMDAAMHEFRKARLAAILWHQGESDTLSDPVQYKQAVIDLLTGLRKRYDPSETAPIILGELAPELTEYAPIALKMNETIHSIVGAIPNSGLARSEKLKTNGVLLRKEEDGTEVETPYDYTHFTAAAQIELGKRYFCAFAHINPPKVNIATTSYCKQFSMSEPSKSLSLISWAIGLLTSAFD